MLCLGSLLRLCALTASVGKCAGPLQRQQTHLPHALGFAMEAAGASAWVGLGWEGGLVAWALLLLLAQGSASGPRRECRTVTKSGQRAAATACLAALLALHAAGLALLLLLRLPGGGSHIAAGALGAALAAALLVGGGRALRCD